VSAEVGDGEVVEVSGLEAAGGRPRGHAPLEEGGLLAPLQVGVVEARHHFIHGVADQVDVDRVLEAEAREVGEVHVTVERRRQSRLLPDFIDVPHYFFLRNTIIQIRKLS